MSRESFTYSHGDTGVMPDNPLDFQENQRPKAPDFDWFWYSVIQSIDGHAEEFDRLDDDNDGIVDEADTITPGGNLKGDLKALDGELIWDETGGYISQSALQNDTISVAGNSVPLGGSTDIALGDLSNVTASGEGDGNGLDADTVDGQNYSDIQNWVNTSSDVPNADYADDADTVDGFHASSFADASHANDTTNPHNVTDVEVAGDGMQIPTYPTLSDVPTLSVGEMVYTEDDNSIYIEDGQ